jgi:histidine kinase-like protein
MERRGHAGGMDVVFSSRADTTPQAIAPLRHAMVAAFQAAGGDPSRSDDVALAVTEACANAVRDAYPTGGDARMTNCSSSRSATTAAYLTPKPKKHAKDSAFGSCRKSQRPTSRPAQAAVPKYDSPSRSHDRRSTGGRRRSANVAPSARRCPRVRSERLG